MHIHEHFNFGNLQKLRLFGNWKNEFFSRLDLKNYVTHGDREKGIWYLYTLVHKCRVAQKRDGHF